MGKLTGLLVVVAGLWAGWWYLGAEGVETGLARWLEERRADGWVAEASDIGVSGFPGRFVARIADFELADPETGLAWRAPGFSFAAPSWKPTEVTLTLPAEQVVATPLERIAVTSEAMTARLALVPGPSLAFTEAAADLSGVALASTLGWSAEVAAGTLRAVRHEDGANRYDLRLDLGPIALDAPALQGRVSLPGDIREAALDATVGFDAPWDRAAIETRRPQPRSIDLRRLALAWGGIELHAAGDLSVDAEGIPEGDVQVRAVNWRQLLDLARQTGQVPEDLVDLLEGGLKFLAGLSGKPDTLELPLSFRDGQIAFGPIPLGPAPRLTIR